MKMLQQWNNLKHHYCNNTKIFYKSPALRHWESGLQEYIQVFKISSVFFFLYLQSFISEFMDEVYHLDLVFQPLVIFITWLVMSLKGKKKKKDWKLYKVSSILMIADFSLLYLAFQKEISDIAVDMDFPF